MQTARLPPVARGKNGVPEIQRSHAPRESIGSPVYVAKSRAIVSLSTERDVFSAFSGHGT
jgi:hypothetical protein